MPFLLLLELWAPSDGRTKDEYLDMWGLSQADFNKVQVMAPQVKDLIQTVVGFTVSITVLVLINVMSVFCRIYNNKCSEKCTC